MRNPLRLGLLALAFGVAGLARSAPAIVYDMGGKFDKSFNEAAYRGYEQGVKHANPKGEVFVNMVGTTGTAWNDPARGGELARAQFAKGADVIFAAAGGTGIGIYQAAKDSGKLAIGVDSNQNHLQPG